MNIVKGRFFAGNNMDRPTSAILHSNNYNTFSRDGQGEGETIPFTFWTELDLSGKSFVEVNEKDKRKDTAKL